MTVKQHAARPARDVVFGFLAIAVMAALVGDLSITTRTPGHEMQRMLIAALTPQWMPWRELLSALVDTIAYAIVAVSIAALFGLVLSLFYASRRVRYACAAVRAVHELFWGLLFVQLLGIQPLTAVLAIALPYSGIFAKVFAEIFEEARAEKPPLIAAGTDRVSRFAYGEFATVRDRLAEYTLYRFECGLRSSIVLGFIGLPTLGYHLVTAFMQGHYSAAAGLLLVLYALIGSLRLWMHWFLWLPVAISALVWCGINTRLENTLLLPLLRDMLPAPLRVETVSWQHWLHDVFWQQALPGVWNTLLVAQMALVLAALLALLWFPLLSRHFSNGIFRAVGHCVLVILRTTPELLITFVLLLVWGPSMLPAVVAMGVHNGAIIANLAGRFSDEVQLRMDASRHLDRYSFEILPRIFGQFLAFVFYRWEIILRESAVLGVLGIQTLGFFIDSAFEAFRLDVAVLLIAVSAALNILVENLGILLRQRQHLQPHPDTQTPAPAI